MPYKPKLDEKGNVVLKDDLPVWTDDSGAETALDPNDMAEKIQTYVREATQRKDKIRKLEDRYKPIEEFFQEHKVQDIGSFLDQVNSDKETVASLKQKDLDKAENVKRIKDEIEQAWEEKRKKREEEFATREKELGGHIDKLSGQIRHLMISNRFASCDLFAGTDPKTTMPPDVAESFFGKFFRVEEHNGEPRVIAYVNGDQILSREQPGEPADFDEAMRLIFDRWPGKDRVLRSVGAGSGSKGGGTVTPGQSSKDNIADLERQLSQAKDPLELIRIQGRIEEVRLRKLQGG